MKSIRVYADTSVFGGAYHDEFKQPSLMFFEQVKIVHFQKIPLYNAVNTLRGYQQIAIFSPREVIQYEEEEV